MFSFLKREGRKEESKVDSPGTPSAFILQRQLLTKLLSVKDNPVALSKEAKIAADWLKEWEVDEPFLASLWSLVSPLITIKDGDISIVEGLGLRNSGNRCRKSGWRLLYAILESQYHRLGGMKASVFKTVSLVTNTDFKFRQEALRLLTYDGANIDLLEKEIADLLRKWIRELRTNSISRNSFHEYEEVNEINECTAELLDLIAKIIKKSGQNIPLEMMTQLTFSIIELAESILNSSDIALLPHCLNCISVILKRDAISVSNLDPLIRVLCFSVNFESVASWHAVRAILSSSLGHTGLRSLLSLIETPELSDPSVLRGAIFCVGMSCWGSKKINSLRYPFNAVLIPLQRALQCKEGLVVYEIVLSVQRLITKYGPRLHMEWHVLLQILKDLRLWAIQTSPVLIAINDDAPVEEISPSTKVPKRIDQEILATIEAVETLYRENQFTGTESEFFELLEEYVEDGILKEKTMLLILEYHATHAHPSNDKWLQRLDGIMKVFFVNEKRSSIRLEVISTLHTIVWLCRFIAEDIVVEKIVIKYFSTVHQDPDAEVRKRGIHLIVEVLRNIEDLNLFNALYDMLSIAASFSSFSDVKYVAVNGIVSIFGSCFSMIPCNRVSTVFNSICTLLISTESTAAIRKVLLECVKRISADQYGLLKFLDEFNEEQTSTLISSERSQFYKESSSPFVVLPISKLVDSLICLLEKELDLEIYLLTLETLTVFIKDFNIIKDISLDPLVMQIKELLSTAPICVNIQPPSYSNKKERADSEKWKNNIAPRKSKENQISINQISKHADVSFSISEFDFFENVSESEILNEADNLSVRWKLTLLVVYLSRLLIGCINPTQTGSDAMISQDKYFSLAKSLIGVVNKMPLLVEEMYKVVNPQITGPLANNNASKLFRKRSRSVSNTGVPSSIIISENSKEAKTSNSKESIVDNADINDSSKEQYSLAEQNEFIGKRVNSIISDLDILLSRLLSCFTVIASLYPSLIKYHLPSIIKCAHQIYSLAQLPIINGGLIEQVHISTVPLIQFMRDVLVPLSTRKVATNSIPIPPGLNDNIMRGSLQNGRIISEKGLHFNLEFYYYVFEILIEFSEPIVHVVNASIRKLHYYHVYHGMVEWFLHVPLSDRKHVALKVVPQLKEKAKTHALAESVVDILSRISYSENDVEDLSLCANAKPLRGALFDDSVNNNSTTWIQGNNLISIRNGNVGVSEVTVRRATGTTRWLMQMQNRTWSDVVHPYLRHAYDNGTSVFTDLMPSENSNMQNNDANTSKKYHAVPYGFFSLFSPQADNMSPSFRPLTGPLAVMNALNDASTASLSSSAGSSLKTRNELLAAFREEALGPKFINDDTVIESSSYVYSSNKAFDSSATRKPSLSEWYPALDLLKDSGSASRPRQRSHTQNNRKGAKDSPLLTFDEYKAQQLRSESLERESKIDVKINSPTDSSADKSPSSRMSQSYESGTYALESSAIVESINEVKQKNHNYNLESDSDLQRSLLSRYGGPLLSFSTEATAFHDSPVLEYSSVAQKLVAGVTHTTPNLNPSSPRNKTNNPSLNNLEMSEFLLHAPECEMNSNSNNMDENKKVLSKIESLMEETNMISNFASRESVAESSIAHEEKATTNFQVDRIQLKSDEGDEYEKNVTENITKSHVIRSVSAPLQTKLKDAGGAFDDDLRAFNESGSAYWSWLQNEKKDGRDEGTFITNKNLSPMLTTSVPFPIAESDLPSSSVPKVKDDSASVLTAQISDGNNTASYESNSETTNSSVTGALKSVDFEPMANIKSWVPSFELPSPLELEPKSKTSVSHRLSASIGGITKEAVNESLPIQATPSSMKETDSINVNPAFIAMQICSSLNFNPGETQPVLQCPSSEDLDRALKLLDRTPCVETHKIGIVYVAENQTKEQEILYNSKGNSRYTLFLHNLGTLIKFDEVANEGKYMGGLDVFGDDGEYALSWRDPFTEVIFHVATLMPSTYVKTTSSSNNSFLNYVIQKKRHIGNDYVVIVWNENNNTPFEFSTIKGNLTAVYIVITPLNFGLVKVDTIVKKELLSFGPLGEGRHIVSPASLPSLVRLTAFNANLMCATIYDKKLTFTSNWEDRLLQLKKIKNNINNSSNNNKNDENINLWSIFTK